MPRGVHLATQSVSLRAMAATTAGAASCYRALGSVSRSAHFDCKGRVSGQRRDAHGRQRFQRLRQVSAVLDTPSEKTDGDPSRIALERLFLGDATTGSDAKGLEPEVPHVVLDEELKRKEKELEVAETVAQEDQEEVECTKFALVKRGNELEEAREGQGRKRDEIGALYKELAEKTKVAETAQKVVQEQQRQLEALQRTLSSKQEVIARSIAQMLAKNEALGHSHRELKGRDLRLKHANGVIAEQSMELKELRSSLELKEAGLKALEENVKFKQEQIQKTEADLSTRVIAYLSVEKELKELEEELSKTKSRNLEVGKELKAVKALLLDVEEELKVSQARLQQYKKTVEEQSLQIKNQQEEIVLQKTLVESFEFSLDEAKERTKREEEQVRLAKEAYKALEEKSKAERQETEMLQVELNKEKEAFRKAIEEIYSLRRELQHKETALSDTGLALQLKEAELAASQVELEKLRSGFSSMKLELDQKDSELKHAQTVVTSLQQDVKRLKALLATKEEKHVETVAALRNKEEELVFMRKKLDANNVKMSQVSFAVEQISALSEALVEAISDNKELPLDRDSVLLQTNHELFASNRALLENEVLTVRLQEKAAEDEKKLQHLEREVESTKELLTEKDLELQDLHKAVADNEFSPDVVKLDDLQPAVTALQSLVELSSNLSDGVGMLDLNTGREEESTTLERQLDERDEALVSTKLAVMNLAELTRQLLAEAAC